MLIEKEVAIFNRQVQALVSAQQRMEDEGCPNVLAPEETRRIAENLATEDLARGSVRVGTQVRNGAIARADVSARKIAVQHGPRIPGGRGNGQA